MTQSAHPVCIRVVARRARAAARDIRCAHEESTLLVVDHDMTAAVGAVALHATARVEQIFAVIELAVGRRKRHLQRRQRNEPMHLAIGEPADDDAGKHD